METRLEGAQAEVSTSRQVRAGHGGAMHTSLNCPFCMHAARGGLQSLSRHKVMPAKCVEACGDAVQNKSPVLTPSGA